MPHEPKKRHSRQRQGQRRAAISHTLPNIIICKNCGSQSLPHRICPACGYYKGKQIVTK